MSGPRPNLRRRLPVDVQVELDRVEETGDNFDRANITRGARQELWRLGLAASYLLDTSGPTGGQQAWVRGLNAIPEASWAAWKISRQRGKTFTALTWALQRMGLEPNLSVVYIAQTGGNAGAIVGQFLREVADDLPPEWGVRHVADHVICANGSELAYFGTDNKQYRRRRGRNAKVLLADEAAFYEDLLDVEQVYTPQLQTTRGVGLYLSSPPISPAHPFNARCNAARAVGRYVHDTFWSNPRIDHEGVIKGECQRLGLTREQLLASTAFRREFLAEDVTEESRAAFPAWNEELHRRIVRKRERPQYFDAYTSLDFGFMPDPSFVLFAWYSPDDGLHIEHELELHGRTLKQLSDEGKRVEGELWGVKRFEGTLFGAGDWELELGRAVPEYVVKVLSQHAPRQPFLRVGDDEKTVLAELSAEHKWAVLPSAKDDKPLAVDRADEVLRSMRVTIDPGCVRFIEQLYTTVWNRHRTGWERTARDHGDAIDAFVYLVRNLRWNRRVKPLAPDAWTGKTKKSGWEKMGL